MTMRKKTDTLTDFDKQLIAGMEEVAAYINGEPNKGRATVVEFADANAIRVGLGMSQAVLACLRNPSQDLAALGAAPAQPGPHGFRLPLDD
jgi:hypothetical protein